MSLIIRGGQLSMPINPSLQKFFCEDGIINIDRAFYSSYYGAIEKRSIANSPFAVNR